MYCRQCGKEIHDEAVVCVNCGVPTEKYAAVDPESKSKIGAGLLGIFLGVWGVHNFYLGYTGKAVAQLLLGTVGVILIFGPIVSGIWGLVEGIMILTGSINVDASGKKLKD